MSATTLILGRRDISELMQPADYLAAMEAGFHAEHLGQAHVAMPMHIGGKGGTFHAKGASLDTDRCYVALKFNGNFPGNPDRNDLPTIQGALILSDGENGAVLAIMDSIEITRRRTAAATALAARHLARPSAETLLVCGCGEQARAHVKALVELLPIARVLVWDVDPERARTLTTDIRDGLHLDCDTVYDLSASAQRSDVIVTCSTAQTPFLGASDCAPGAFIAAVGADHPDKSEIRPDLFTRAKIVVDNLDQCVAMGDLRHAILAGTVMASDVYATLAEVVGGAKEGRKSSQEIILFDSTGTAIQDVACAARIYQRARNHGLGRGISLVD